MSKGVTFEFMKPDRRGRLPRCNGEGCGRVIQRGELFLRAWSWRNQGNLCTGCVAKGMGEGGGEGI